MPRGERVRVGCKSVLGETAVLDRLGNMRRKNGVARRQIGDRARDLEHAVIGARREVEAGDGVFQQRGAGAIRLAVGVDFLGAQACVRLVLARLLARASACETRSRRWPTTRSRQRLAAPRPAAPAPRSADRCGRAADPRACCNSAPTWSGEQRQRLALSPVPPVMPARTRIHRRDELELRRKIRLPRRA